MRPALKKHFSKKNNGISCSLGVTLIELLVVVSIIATLLVIGVPLYLEEVNSTYRAECRNSIIRGHQLLERAYTYNGTASYPASFNPLLGVNSNRTYSNPDNPSDTINSACVIDYETSGNPPTGYTLTATPRAIGGKNWSKGECRAWVINQFGSKTISVSSRWNEEKCWEK